MAPKKPPHVFVYMTFHVRNRKLAKFCEALSSLLSATKKDTGCVRMDLHRELPWANSISNDEFSLFMMCQEWTAPQHLEAHNQTAHASRFNEAMITKRMLVTEPSVSIFGAPLSPSDLAALGAESTARIAASVAAAQAQAQAQASSDGASLLSQSTHAREGEATGAEEASRLSTPSSVARSGSRSSLLRNSGTLTLKK
eukprot:TRINITY_DN44348_c0_g1_i1.p1 TRINITY_DN44348_c0_g1~~TRINITY_DN44348_c0_g1_i1.p1  ORF type:complete len:229 (-),score=22.13 TRINITY_DN44348_c0_g1_i1:125-718(-)